jgi:hypothetical protein
MDSYFDGSYYYLVFAAYHTYLSQTTNYSIYQTTFSILDGISNNSWTYATEVLSSLSSSTTNQNSFIYPKVNYDGEFYWLLFNANVVTSVTTQTTPGGSQPVYAENNYFLSKTKDLVNFTYPIPVIMLDGTIFTDTTGDNFVYQNGYFYIAGNGKLWQFIQNDLVADISNYIISITGQEQGGSPSSINLVIANQNGQWFGPSPTLLNYQAIQSNRKILLDLGYYNSNGIPETAPRNIFYIDDIEQNVTYSTNDLTITGRDYRKALMSTVSKFSYNYAGPSYTSDIFDGTTVSNWNQVVGGWIQNTAGHLNAWTQLEQTGILGEDAGTEYTMTSTVQIIPETNYVYSVICNFPDPTLASTSYLLFYAFYQDSNNWIRLMINSFGNSSYWEYSIQVNIDGNLINIYTSTFSTAGGHGIPYPVIIKKSGYLFSFTVGYNYGTNGNGIFAFNGGSPAQWLYSVDLSYYFNGQYTSGGKAYALSTGAVGFGCQDAFTDFRYFKFMQYNSSLNIGELIQNLATKGGIFDYKIKQYFTDNFFTTGQLAGTFSVVNRNLVITPSNYAYKTDIQVSNGEVEFEAKLSPTVSTSAFGFNMIFRSQETTDTTNCYLWENSSQRISSVQFVQSNFKINTSAASADIASSSDNIYNSASTFNNLNLDLTQWHTYKLIMTDGYLFGFVDDTIVVCWNDNNTLQNFANGYIGFIAEANTTLFVRNISSSVFWNQVTTYSINPGDDLETSVDNAVQIMGGWHYSDLLGRTALTILQSTDPSTYTYEDEIQTQVTDNSGKEYINEVTVYGNGVFATAQNAVLIATTGTIREQIISDYKILTYQDALTAAQNALITNNIYLNQSQPVAFLNVGSEVFDPITIINNGLNSSNVNSTLRIYNNNLTVGGDSTNTAYNLSMQTGNM